MAVSQELKNRVYQWAATIDKRPIPDVELDERTGLPQSPIQSNNVDASALRVSSKDLNDALPDDLAALTTFLRAGLKKSLTRFHPSAMSLLDREEFDATSPNHIFVHEGDHLLLLPESCESEAFVECFPYYAICTEKKDIKKDIGLWVRCVSPRAPDYIEALVACGVREMSPGDVVLALQSAQRTGNNTLIELVDAMVLSKSRRRTSRNPGGSERTW